MRCRMTIVFIVLLGCAVAGAVDLRLWLAPALPGQVPWLGTGGPFAPTLVGTTQAEGGVGAAIYSSATVSTAGINPPAPIVPVLEHEASGEIFGIWARAENDSAPETHSGVRGMSLLLQTTPGLEMDVQWIQWRAGMTGSYNFRWEPYDLEGREVTVFSSDGPPRGWQFIDGTSDRLDRWTLTRPDEDPPMGNSEILLGYIRAVSGSGAVRIRLGANGINHIGGTRVAFGDGTEYIPGGVGAPGRGYGDQLVVLPEPTTALFLALPFAALRRRKLLSV